VTTPDAGHQPGSQVVVLSGPSGSGKTTIVHRLLRESPVRLMMSISATTRPQRPAEVDGRDYYFLAPDEFERRRAAGQFLECAEVHRSGYWYGTLFSELDRAAAAGAWPLLEIDVEGALNVMRSFPHVLSIFVTTPEAEYERRLRARGTEAEAIVQRRLQTARNELQSAGSYTYCVVNDDLDRAVREICTIIAQREAALHAG